MIFREAKLTDIPQLQVVRQSVRENVLSNHMLITELDYIIFLTVRGKGWVCEMEGVVVGFAIADVQGNNIWALFLKPEFEKKGIGRRLHDTMLNWYFMQTKVKVWLGTAFNTRAAYFYRKAGWTEVGAHRNNEIKFEMTYEQWQQLNRPDNLKLNQ